MSWSASETHVALLLPFGVLAVDVIRRLIQARIQRGGLPLPPGPPSPPLLGSALSLDSEVPWETYTQWGATYGDVIYTRMLDQDVVILNSQSDAMELLEKRSRIYSDRPFLPTLAPFGWDHNFAFIPYGDHWRLCRRIFHQTFRAEAAVSFRPMQLRRAREMVMNLIETPTEYFSHYGTFAASIVMSSTYGYEPQPQNDPMVHIIERFLLSSVEQITPEKGILLRMFPFLLYLPDWCPGSSYKLKSLYARKCSREMLEVPYQYAEREMPMESMVAEHINRMQKYDEPYRSEYTAALKKACVTSFIAASETSSTTLMTFTLAMVMNPRVWKRAQVEIDAVVGTGRLPEYDDRPSLPYIDAIMRETLRWQPSVPLGVPHATTSSDIYKGYYIPKGTTVMVNAWAMARDEARYPNAAEFIPERFLNADGSLTSDDPGQFIFGFGRRICAGRYAADASIWISIVTMLAALDFSCAKDSEGKDIEFEPTYLNGLTRRPEIFPCSITPRAHISDKAALQQMAKGNPHSDPKCAML
ncbi:cytochrome P450 [Phlebopus sp. FC_14]|nr:cytochrome P450 [Phlebopus sp. FC_14]